MQADKLAEQYNDSELRVTGGGDIVDGMYKFREIQDSAPVYRHATTDRAASLWITLVDNRWTLFSGGGGAHPKRVFSIDKKKNDNLPPAKALWRGDDGEVQVERVQAAAEPGGGKRKSVTASKHHLLAPARPAGPNFKRKPGASAHHLSPTRPRRGPTRSHTMPNLPRDEDDALDALRGRRRERSLEPAELDNMFAPSRARTNTVDIRGSVSFEEAPTIPPVLVSNFTEQQCNYISDPNKMQQIAALVERFGMDFEMNLQTCQVIIKRIITQDNLDKANMIMDDIRRNYEHSMKKKRDKELKRRKRSKGRKHSSSRKHSHSPGPSEHAVSHDSASTRRMLEDGVPMVLHKSNSTKTITCHISYDTESQSIIYFKGSKRHPEGKTYEPIPLIDVDDISKGKDTSAVWQRPAKSRIDAECCLSVMTRSGNHLFLEFVNKEDRDGWAKALHEEQLHLQRKSRRVLSPAIGGRTPPGRKPH